MFVKIAMRHTVSGGMAGDNRISRAGPPGRAVSLTDVNVGDLLANIRETLTARQVFGEPIERDGVVVVPAAVVYGGGGGGVGQLAGERSDGGGFGLLARPTGAFVITGGTARWVPALDVNRLGVVAGVVAVVWLLVRRRSAG
jgi:uncharacterized spore protein YtfJ